MIVRCEVATRTTYEVELPDGTPKAQAKIDAPAKLRTQQGAAPGICSTGTTVADWATVTIRPVAFVQTTTDTNV